MGINNTHLEQSPVCHRGIFFDNFRILVQRGRVASLMKQIIRLCEGRFGLPPVVKVTAAGYEHRCHYEADTKLEWSDVKDSQLPHFPNPLAESSGQTQMIDNEMAGV